MQLEQIRVYPVKSLPGVRLRTSRVDERGLFMDRHWMLVDKDTGRFITQREFPSLALIDLGLENETVVLTIPGQGTWTLNRDNHSGKQRSVTVWQDSLTAWLVGDDIDRAFSAYLQQPVSLMEIPEEVVRPVDPRYAKSADQTGFADGFPFLLLSEASLEDLNQRLPAGQKMTVERFRPNLLVSGCEAYEEDEWQTIAMGGIVFRVVKPCSRCAITTVDPLSGQKGAEPLKTLAGYRRRGNQVYFGQNLLHDHPGLLTEGDALTVISP